MGGSVQKGELLDSGFQARGADRLIAIGKVFGFRASRLQEGETGDIQEHDGFGSAEIGPFLHIPEDVDQIPLRIPAAETEGDEHQILVPGVGKGEGRLLPDREGADFHQDRLLRRGAFGYSAFGYSAFRRGAFGRGDGRAEQEHQGKEERKALFENRAFFYHILSTSQSVVFIGKIQITHHYTTRGKALSITENFPIIFIQF